MKNIRGFTIVELLIVIVVIAVLATIAVTTYNGIQNRAHNSARLSQLKDWVKIFEMYRTLNGDYPAMTIGNSYCLGTGFPVGFDGERRCRDYLDGDNNKTYKESDSAALLEQLKTISSTLPGGSPLPVNETVGPYVSYWNGELQFVGVFAGSECPAGTTESWDDHAGLMMCDITLER